jgi:hypothetical protein
VKPAIIGIHTLVDYSVGLKDRQQYSSMNSSSTKDGLTSRANPVAIG